MKSQAENPLPDDSEENEDGQKDTEKNSRGNKIAYGVTNNLNLRKPVLVSCPDCKLGAADE